MKLTAQNSRLLKCTFLELEEAALAILFVLFLRSIENKIRPKVPNSKRDTKNQNKQEYIPRNPR